jgi:ligand-binding sensor domain-containing protein
MLTLRIIILLSFISLSLSNGQPSIDHIGQPFINNFPARQYKAHPTNFAVVQDKNGILYFGNLWCVLQFDGTLWRSIHLPHGASCNALAIDSDGTIYVGGRNSIGYLKRDSTGAQFYVSLLQDLPAHQRKFNEIWKIAINESGIFFSSYEKLFFRDRKTKKLNVIRENPWYVFAAMDKVYITDKSGLHTFQNNEIIKVPNSEKFNGKFINAISHLGNKLLISTSEDGIYLFDGHKAIWWNAPVNKILRQFNPTKIENINNHHLIICTELNGVFITDMQGNILSHFNKSNGLIDNTVSSFFLDDHDLLWLATYNGIAVVPVFKQVNYINDYNGVSGVPYSSAVYDQKLYLATSEGLFSRSLDGSDSSKKFVRVHNGLVWSLHVVDNKLFCGQAITAFVIDHEKEETLYNEGTWMFLPLSSSTMLMGTYSGLHYLRKENEKWRYDKRLKGFDGSGRSFAVDKMGDIWVVRDNKGISRLRLSSDGDSVTHIKNYSSTEGLPAQNGNTITRLNDQILVTTAKGVYHYDHNTETMVPNKPLNDILMNYGYRSVKKIIADPTGDLWIATSEGSLAKIAYKKDEATLVENTERVRGKLITDFEHIHALGDIMVIGTVDGFAVYKHHMDKAAKLPFSAFVSKIDGQRNTISNGDYGLKAINAPLPYSENTVRFTFACNSYEDLNTNQYQYYLEGFGNEKSWSALTFIPFKEYTNLEPGSYKFHLRAVNFEHQVSNETTVTFTILPPWYRSWWSYLLYALMFTGFNYVFFRRVKHRIEREKKRVAQEKQHQLWMKQKEWEEAMLRNRKQMVALQQEKLEIEKAALQEKEQLIENEKLHERQMMELEKEKLEADIRHKNNELSSLTLHITQKNEMITRIANQLTKTIQESRDEVAVKHLREIKTSLEKGLDSHQEWEKFINHFDIVHEGFLKRLKQQYPDLSTSTLKLCAFIRMRLSSKQIATLMNTVPASVLKARYRLRTKFNLSKETGLEEFLNGF